MEQRDNKHTKIKSDKIKRTSIWWKFYITWLKTKPFEFTHLQLVKSQLSEQPLRTDPSKYYIILYVYVSYRCEQRENIPSINFNKNKIPVLSFFYIYTFLFSSISYHVNSQKGTNEIIKIKKNKNVCVTFLFNINCFMAQCHLCT